MPQNLNKFVRMTKDLEFERKQAEEGKETSRGMKETNEISELPSLTVKKTQNNTNKR